MPNGAASEDAGSSKLHLLILHLPLLASPLGQSDPVRVRWFLFIVMGFIVLLFIAVAIILPLSLRLARPRRKGAGPEPFLNPIDEDTLPFDNQDRIPTQLHLPVVKSQTEPQTGPTSGRRPANINWQIAGLTDVGLKRTLNEDAFLIAEEEMAGQTCYGLYVVADGMGGHHGGEVASRLTVETVAAHLTQHPPTELTQFNDWLKAAVMAANQSVLARQEHLDPEKKMGSTIVLALVIPGQAHIANVGDSRAYHLHGEGIKQISVDHSLVERLIQIGQLTREEARTHRQKNVIYNTIGDKANLEVSFYHVNLQSGDRLLLCSDGLNGMLTDEQILEISRSQPDPVEACKTMIEAAKLAGGSDNITALIIQMEAG